MVKDETLELLKEKIRHLGDLPGCYLWKDISAEVIYVGKAIRLSDRVRSYLNPNQSDLKTISLQREIHDLEWIITNTEEEALILESNLIKKYNPKYNIRLKDDKKYPFICVSTDEPYPMVFITRKVKADGKRYFGPYTDVKGVRDLLSMIHKIFPIRKTPLKLPLSKPGRPCLNFHIKRCLGPCRGVVSVEEYSVVVEEVLKFMEGKREELILKLHERMNQHSEKMEFERAVIYRDMINNMNTLQKKQSIINYIDGEEDIVAFARREDEGQVVIFEVREGRLEGKKSFAIKGMKDAKEEEIFFSFFKLYYPEASFIPDKIITPSILKEESEEGKTLLDLLKSRSGKKVKFASPRAGHKRSLLRLAEKNAEMNLSERLLATKLKDQKLALEELKENLKLKEIPTVIECYDISHFQGTEPVASGVMFVDGKPYKNGYRHYKIKGYSGINDPGMMHEVIARRLQRLLNENESLPDLIVIDGGETQLGRASEAAIALGLNDLPMVGLAKKREEIYFPGEKIPYSFDENSPSMKLLRQIRDEAHRFGVTFHRERRNKATMKSLLDGIGDIGKERRRAVLKFFSDKKKIEDATEAELKEVPGIGEKLAKKIYESLKSLNSLPK